MRFTIATTIVAFSSTLALFSQAALTPQERVAYQLENGQEANLCAPCLQKAMHNHFPHACAADMDSDAVNSRPEGSTQEEERCVCLAFLDLYWMKADCSLECPYVYSEASMKYFLPAEKIDGCNKWVDFEERKEIPVEGFPPKDPNHTPKVFPITPAPPKPEGAEDVQEDDGRFKVSVHVEHDEKKKAQLELEEAQKKKKEEEKTKEENQEEKGQEENKQAEADDKAQPEEAIKKDEL
ncbi:hypothetical protein BGZ65_012612 [Modicella reniformis]|uniref:Uncharacterized protein n=1 Tax=Modicella reniformis TaxID=1440133 RepID=A0A9P6LTD9_9FUNG|nr:hypothetical protein BGZ65_012612 [Modicella reniformis]